MAKLLGAKQQQSDAEGRCIMKKLPLFEYEFPSYKKRHTYWADKKLTR